MLYRLAADAVLLLHLAFIVFAVAGALLALRWRWVPWVQLPAAAWAFYVEASAGICPLTYAENHFRRLAGQGGYEGSFIERYLLPLIYPAELTADVQMMLAGVVVLFNAAIYGYLFLGRHR